MFIDFLTIEYVCAFKFGLKHYISDDDVFFLILFDAILLLPCFVANMKLVMLSEEPRTHEKTGTTTAEVQGY